MSEHFGYLLVHFVEDPNSHAEKIYFSLSEGDNPLAWRRLNRGEAVLESVQGTGGVRDPQVVRRPDGGFHIVATDLRVWRPEGPDWWEFRHRGSRDVVIWDSSDLISWSEPRYVELAGEGVGMVWAPKALYDPEAGEFVILWSSGLACEGSAETGESGPSKILMARSKDFVEFSDPEVYFELPGGVIDMAVVATEAGVHRFAKHDDAAPDSLHVFHQRGSSLLAQDFVTVARDIGQEIASHIEGPLIFRDNHEARWYLWVDQYAHMPHGYHAYTSSDLEAGQWERMPDFTLPDNSKHGSVLPLRAAEYQALDSFYPR